MTRTSLYLGLLALGTLFSAGTAWSAGNAPRVGSTSDDTPSREQRPGSAFLSEGEQVAQTVPEFNNNTVRDRKKKKAGETKPSQPAGSPVEGAAKSPGSKANPAGSAATPPAPGPSAPSAGEMPAARNTQKRSAKSRTVVPIELLDGPPDEVWTEYFSKHTPAPESIGDAVLRLLDQKKTDHAIALLEAAIREGQSRPWMYELLALSMEVAGRPKEDVERVMLSNVDFSAVNAPTMLFSAAYLTRFGRNARALELYRQASTIDPSSPEPYILGLKLARKLKDYDAIQWAACGILAYAWMNDFESLHRDAESAAKEAEDALRKAGSTEKADKLAAAVADAKQCDLVAELTWSGKADLDMVVEEPLGTLCSFEHRRTAGGGILAHDGYYPDEKNTYETYICPRGIAGDYRIKVRYVSGEVVGKRAVLKLTRYQGTPQEKVETMVLQLTPEDKVVRVTLYQGRLKELTPVPDQEQSSAAPPRRKNYRDLVSPRSKEARAARDEFMAARGQNARPAGAGVGYQPMISILSEGVSNTASAVVSADRRYVRLSLSPVFSAITDVFTFSFVGGGGGQQQGAQQGGQR